MIVRLIFLYESIFASSKIQVFSHKKSGLCPTKINSNISFTILDKQVNFSSFFYSVSSMSMTRFY